MKNCSACLRKRENPNGTYTCTMTKETILEEDLSIRSCGLYIGANRDNSNVKYKDYDREDQIERIRSCEECKHKTKIFDVKSNCEKNFCPRKDSYIIDADLAASTCGWFHKKK